MLLWDILKGLAVAAITAILSGLWVKFHSRTRFSKKTYLLLLGILIGLSVVLAVTTYVLLTIESDQPADQRNIGWQIIVVVSVIQGLLGIFILRLVYKVDDIASGKGQFESEHSVLSKHKDQITIRKLVGNVSGEDKLPMNWQTFGNGLAFLRKQIECYSPAIAPDICLGVNLGGLMMASYLSGVLTQGLRVPACIRTGSPNHDVKSFAILGGLDENSVNQILLLDYEVKSGRSLKSTVEYLKDRFGESCDIKIGVLVACQVRSVHPTLQATFEETSFKQDSKFIPNFLAFVFDGRVAPLK